MTRVTKICLVTGLAGLGAGLLVCLGIMEVGSQVALYITLPVGVTFLGLALICYALEKEVAQFDEDRNTSSPVVPPKSERAAAENPRRESPTDSESWRGRASDRDQTGFETSRKGR